MEYFWMILAAVGAGIGTGLAGLSAATVMVPVLITLCPSFAGETGAYQATAIALASDILGSAVTTGIYIRNKNIDLKRGWIMLACIVCMCTVGSFAAWKAGNVVLGSFTLFLTFCIGIRFLVKPDTTRKETAARGAGLTVRGVLISLFFGLTIGFGTGFVGSGGGMMMLVVFTAFLGMELKPAVGTSTFIMTFTALIASVSHILIHPAIILEKWLPLLLCIGFATLASLISAQFANRVNNRTVGLVTGVILTVLGAAMLFLHYRELLLGIPVIVQMLHCIRDLVLFLAPCVAAVLVIRLLVKHIPDFVFRKLLHIIAFTCITWMTARAESWQAAALTAVLAAAVIYPVLRLLEPYPWFARFFVQKSSHEIRRSLIMLFGMYAVLAAVAWGIFGKPALCMAAVLMWGTGDAAAALVGIPFGRHKIRWRLTDGKKSWEGSAAMLLVCAAAGAAVLLHGGMSPVQAAVMVPAGAAAGTLTELVSPSEIDTVTVPAVILAMLLAFS